jgi:hypothetical protein
MSGSKPGYETIGDFLGTGTIVWIDREIAIEEHRQGLKVGLSVDHCPECRKVYIEQNCLHEVTTVIQTLDMPAPHTYCSTCGKHMSPAW